MILPFRPESDAVPPSAVAGHPNGKIPSHLLEPCGIRTFVMAAPAARAMRAMVKAANRDGVRLSATGTYRSYDRQVALFNERYTTNNTGRSSKTWNGVKYYLKPNMASAATPGRSNHGTGVAVDLAEFNDRGDVVSLSRRTLDWLAANGPRFGFWNTVSSEAWHWCWCLGDQVPPAVLAEESGTVPAPAPAPAPSGRTYTVVSGDSWWSIAQKTLGKGTRWKEISDLNGSVRTLYPGQVVKVPGA